MQVQSHTDRLYGKAVPPRSLRRLRETVSSDPAPAPRLIREVWEGSCRILLRQMRENAPVEVFPAQMRVSRGGFHDESLVVEVQQRHVERAAAEIEHQHFIDPGFFMQAVGERGLQ